MFMKKYIQLLSIEPLHAVETTNWKRTVYHLKNRKERSPLLIVDKREATYNEYVLVCGHSYYQVLYDQNPDQMVFCNVISRRNRRKELDAVLQVVLQANEPNRHVIHYLVWELFRMGESVAALAKQLKCSMEETKEVLIDPAIPRSYDLGAIEMDKIVALNTIAKSVHFEERVKQTLYTWALHPTKAINLSTIQTMEKMEPSKINTAIYHASL